MKESMRTGNLPANMKKNRVLQIIPCKKEGKPVRHQFYTWTGLFVHILLCSHFRWLQQSHSLHEARTGVHRLHQRILHRCTQFFFLCVTLRLWLPENSRRVFCCHSGLQTEGLLYCHPGPSLTHSGRFLEDGVGVEMSLHCHAHRAPGEGAGKLQQLSLGLSLCNISFILKRKVLGPHFNEEWESAARAKTGRRFHRRGAW